VYEEKHFNATVESFWVLMLLTGCEVYETPRNFEEKNYTIDSSAILERLHSGDAGVFTEVKATPAAPQAAAPSCSIAWRQADYFLVLQALFQTAWHEPLETQKFYTISFELNCADVKQGSFNNTYVYSYKEILSGKEGVRVEYRTNIRPLEASIHTMKEDYTPNTQNIEPVDLKHYRITAEEALQIAEKNGGTDKRLEYADQCEISVNALSMKNQSWDVVYSHNQNKVWKAIFEMVVDGQTGTYKKVYPKS
jgi:hypothetical protein